MASENHYLLLYKFFFFDLIDNFIQSGLPFSSYKVPISDFIYIEYQIRNWHFLNKFKY